MRDTRGQELSRATGGTGGAALNILPGVDGLAIFSGTVIVAVLVTGGNIAPRERREIARVVAAAASLLLAVSTRNLLWIYVGFEAFTVATGRARLGALVASVVSLGGLVTVALSNPGVDLAVLESGTKVSVGVGLFLSGLMLKWLHVSTEEGLGFLAAAVAVVAVFIRVSAWAPDTAVVIAPFTSIAASALILVGGVVTAVSAKAPRFLAGLTVAHAGLAIAAVPGGAPLLPHVLLHLAASAVAIALMHANPPRLGLWVLSLSLASVPPFPGFVTKLGLVAGVPLETRVVMLAGCFLIGIGCAGALARPESSPRGRWVALAALAMTLALGLFPEPAFRLATRAATGLF